MKDTSTTVFSTVKVKRGNSKPNPTDVNFGNLSSHNHVKENSKPEIANFNAYIQMVEKKAYELYEKRGRQPGHEKEDWIAAEKIIEAQLHK